MGANASTSRDPLEIIPTNGVIWSTEMGYVIAFALFIVMMFARPGGLFARRQ